LGKVVDQLSVAVDESDATAELIFQDVNGDGMQDMFVQTSHGMRNVFGIQFIAASSGKFTAIKLTPSYLPIIKKAKNLIVDYITENGDIETQPPNVVAPGDIVYHWMDANTEGVAVCAKIQNNLLVPLIEVDFMNYSDSGSQNIDVTVFNNATLSRHKFYKQSNKR
jgi:hypothetical protein